MIACGNTFEVPVPARAKLSTTDGVRYPGSALGVSSHEMNAKVSVGILWTLSPSTRISFPLRENCYCAHDISSESGRERWAYTYGELLLCKSSHCISQGCKPNTRKACDLGSIQKISRGCRNWKKIASIIRGRGGHGLGNGWSSEQE
jgi:hypothetical protein